MNPTDDIRVRMPGQSKVRVFTSAIAAATFLLEHCDPKDLQALKTDGLHRIQMRAKRVKVFQNGEVCGE